MRYYFDTEFMEDGSTIELLSIGIVAEDGRELYLQNAEADWSRANPWVVQHVLPHLWARPGQGGDRVASRASIAERVQTFVAAGDGSPEWWAYYADYDWVVLCQLYGRMIDLPRGWPMYCRDIKQVADELGVRLAPLAPDMEHHALYDARWAREAHHFLELVRAERRLQGRGA